MSNAKVGSFSIASTDTVGTTIAITGLDFTPKAIICWWSGRDELVDTLGRSDLHAGMGYASSPTSRGVVFGQGEDGVATTNLDDAHRVDALVGNIKTSPPMSGTIEGLADLDSIETDGFTIIIDDQFGLNLEVQYLAFGGDLVEEVAVDIFQSQNSIGTQDITSLSFQPDSVLMLSIGTGTGPPSLFNDMQFTVAAMKSTTEQGMVATGSRNGQGTAQGASLAHQGAEAFSTMRYSPGNIDNRFKFDSFLVNGFRVEHLQADDDDVIFMAIKGANFAIGELQTRTDGANIVTNGLDFKPSAVMFFSHNATEDDPATGGRDSAVLSIGAATGPAERSASYRSDIDNLGTSRLATAVEFDSVYINTDEAAAPAITGLMDLVSMESDGFITVMDDPDPTAAFVMYWAFGLEAAAGGPHRRMLFGVTH